MSGPRRLLTVSNYFDTHRGGLEIVAGRLARELADRGFAVTWLASDAAPAPEPHPGLACRPLKAWNGTERRFGVPWPILSPRSIARLMSAAQEADAVLLHDGLYLASVVAAAAARRAGRPLIVVQHIGEIRYRSPFLRGPMQLANRLVALPMLKGADQVIFISAVVREHFAALGLARPCELIFNGVDAEVFCPADAAERTAARTTFELGDADPVALFVGRFVEKKGLALLRRVARLRPDVRFVLAGWGPEDPDRWGLPNVRVIGGLAGARLAELYRASDVFVLPSRGEGFPLVVQEALASGLPVVCGAESARADPLASGFIEGVEVEDADPDVVAQRLATAIDAALAGPRSAEARAEFARRRYGWPAAADRYAEIIEGLIAPAASPSRDSRTRSPLRAA